MVTSAERVEFLRCSELFHDLPRALVEAIAAQLEEVHYRAGDVVFDRGDEGDAVYVVLDGVLSMEADGVSLLLRNPGECVGEFALIDEGLRSAAAVARSEVRLLRWGRCEFQRALEGDGAIARGIFRMLTHKLREDLRGRLDMQLTQERWQQDLARAKEIQSGMLPPGQWSCATAELAGYCMPADEVGGDYYDYLTLDNSGLGVIIGDVTGHGFYSSLFVAMAKSCFHTQIPFGHGPSTIMAAMRKALDLSIGGHLLMTCCYVLFDAQTRQIRYSNAGHPPALILRADGRTVDVLEAIDPILGALSADLQPEFGEVCTMWASGDLMVLYSDGVIDARAPGGGMFGEARLRNCVSNLAGCSALQARERILNDIAGFGQGEPVGDDMTLVVVKAR